MHVNEILSSQAKLIPSTTLFPEKFNFVTNKCIMQMCHMKRYIQPLKNIDPTSHTHKCAIKSEVRVNVLKLQSTVATHAAYL